MSNTPITLNIEYDTIYLEGSSVPTISTTDVHHYNIQLFLTG